MNIKLRKFTSYFKIEMSVQIIQYCNVNPLTDDKILDWSKLKQIADNILNRKMENKCHIG